MPQPPLIMITTAAKVAPLVPRSLTTSDTYPPRSVAFHGRPGAAVIIVPQSGPRLPAAGAVARPWLYAAIEVRSVSLDGHATQYKLVTTARGTEVRVAAHGKTSSLRITLR